MVTITVSWDVPQFYIEINIGWKRGEYLRKTFPEKFCFIYILSSRAIVYESII